MAVYLSNASFQVDSRPPGVKNWHAGEKAVQTALNYRYDVADNYEIIRSFLLPDQQRNFHSRNISFLPLAVQDDQRRVWASFLCGAAGTPGFIDSPDEYTLNVHARTWKGDPSTWCLKDSSGHLVAGVGIELTTRRRNKLAGLTSAVAWLGQDLELVIKIKETCGNCPKYISVCQLVPSSPNPSIISTDLSLGSDSTLPSIVIDFIKQQDSVYLATSYTAPADAARDFPSHLGLNHRGGRAGYIRVRSDGKTIVLPDYSGNRFMTSLGNIHTDGLAGLVFPSFSTGSILYVTGTAQTLIGPAAATIQPRSRTITLIKVTGYVFVANALPFIQNPSSYIPSPYSPPVRYLAEERARPEMLSGDVEAKLIETKIHRGLGDEEGDSGLTTLTFEVEGKLNIRAGQFVILQAIDPDEIGYAHMRPGDEKFTNEDGVRTWTVSSSHTTSFSTIFTITIRRIGRATNRLFSLASYFSPTNPGAFARRRVVLPVLGIGGEFLLPDSPNKMLWIAGGIGITPFLAFLGALDRKKKDGNFEEGWEIDLLVSTREPEIVLELLQASLSSFTTRSTPNLSLRIKLFSNAPSLAQMDATLTDRPELYSLSTVQGRITKEVFESVTDVGRVYLCGPKEFEEAVMVGLRVANVDQEKITRESFEF